MRSSEADTIRFDQAAGLFAAGYETGQVDDLIADRIVPTLQAYERGGSGVRITAEELGEATFRIGRRGYEARAVDAFLDKVAAQLRKYESPVTGG